MEFIKARWRSILVVLLLIGGLVGGVIFVQKAQIFRSKASSDGFYVTSEKEVINKGGNHYSTKGSSITVTVTSLEELAK